MNHAARKSQLWYNQSRANIRQLQSDIQYEDLESNKNINPAQEIVREEDLKDDKAVLEKDLNRLVPGTVNDPGLRILLFGHEPTDEVVSARVGSVRDLINRFLRIRLRPGYTQGMHLAAALLLAKMNPEKAFWCFVSIVEDIMPIDFYSKPPAAMQGFRVETELIVRLSILMFPEMNNFSEDVDESCLSVAVRMLSAKVLVPLFVDVCPLKITEAIWDRLLGDDVELYSDIQQDMKKNQTQSNAKEQNLSTRTQGGTVGAGIFIHIILGIVAAARPRITPDHESTVIYKELLDIVSCLTEEKLPTILAGVDKTYLDPILIKKYRVQARLKLSARWIENPGRLRKMVRRSEVHFGLELLEKLRKIFAKISEKKGVIDGTMLHKVLCNAQEEGMTMPLKIHTFCAGIIRMHATSVDGLASQNTLKIIGTIDDSVLSKSSPKSVENINTGIDFRELISTLSIALRGTYAQKLRLCFDIFDLNNSGYLKIDQARNMLYGILRISSISSTGNAVENELHACATRFIENLKDVAEASQEYASAEKRAHSRHTQYCFTFSEIHDLLKDESVVRRVLLPNQPKSGLCEDGEDSSNAENFTPKFATDSIVLRSVKAASPDRASSLSAASSKENFQMQNSNNTNSTTPRLHTALLPKNQRERLDSEVVRQKPLCICKCCGYCNIM